MTIEVNYDGMTALKSACIEQEQTFARMQTFFTTNCGSSKFSSIPVLALFSPVYSDAANVVETGLPEAKAAAGRSGDTVRTNLTQYMQDDLAASKRLVGTYTNSEVFTPAQGSFPDDSALPYNGDTRNGLTWGSWAADGSMGRLWPQVDPAALVPGPRYLGGRGGTADVLGVYYDGLDMINASSTAGAGMDDNRQYEAFEDGGSVPGNTPTFAHHEAGAMNLFDAENALTPVEGMDTGPLVEGLMSELGGFIGGINWLLSKLGYDLMGKLLAPVAGSFSDADRVRGNLDVLGGCSRATREALDAYRVEVEEEREDPQEQAEQQRLEREIRGGQHGPALRALQERIDREQTSMLDVLSGQDEHWSADGLRDLFGPVLEEVAAEVEAGEGLPDDSGREPHTRPGIDEKGTW